MIDNSGEFCSYFDNFYKENGIERYKTTHTLNKMEL